MGRGNQGKELFYGEFERTKKRFIVPNAQQMIFNFFSEQEWEEDVFMALEVAGLEIQLSTKQVDDALNTMIEQGWVQQCNSDGGEPLFEVTAAGREFYQQI